ncbi:MAG: hypothetical protein MUP41_01970 [Desulfobacterales bacterium]|nr:hypothetical protein [Desulfobacterales bacterium]
MAREIDEDHRTQERDHLVVRKYLSEKRNEGAVNAIRNVLEIGKTEDDKWLFDFVKTKTGNLEEV